MKLIDKLAKEYVLEHVDPSMQLTMAPDDLCMMVYKAGFQAGIDLFFDRMISLTCEYDAAESIKKMPHKEVPDA